MAFLFIIRGNAARPARAKDVRQSSYKRDLRPKRTMSSLLTRVTPRISMKTQNFK